jgi:hypothetical protein
MIYTSHNTMRRTPEATYLCGAGGVMSASRAVFVTWS